MGKITAAVDTGALRVGNTIATPLRRWWELINEAVFNVLKQGKSSAKNTAEVGKQTIDALADNFLNFSKVQGKRYQRLVKWGINLASAVTRRPAMIAGAGVLSALNQWIWKPFTKLAPGKLFKGLANATRIFSKKKWFDFAQYDTHETWKDTWVNQRKEKHLGFFGAWWSAPAAENKPATEVKKVEAPKVETPVVVDTKKEKPAEKPTEDPHTESDLFQKKIQEQDDAFLDKELAARWFGPGGKLSKESKSDSKKDKPDSKKDAASDKDKTEKDDTSGKKPWSIKDVQANDKKKSEKRAKEENEKNFPEWTTLDKKEQAERKKEYDKTLKNDLTERGILARGKWAKMGDTIEEILENFKEIDRTFVGYMEELLAKKK